MAHTPVHTHRIVIIITKLICSLLLLLGMGCNGGGSDGGSEDEDNDAIEYTLTVTVDGQGMVQLDPAGGVYASGTGVTLTGIPETGWEFVSWSGDATGTGATIVVTVNADTSITAHFQAEAADLPSSADLIDEALDAGEIDAETALTYKVYAAFGDDRLPEEYAGSGPTLVDSHIMDEVASAWDTLTAGTQTDLDPFFVPPYYAGSWYDLMLTRTAATSNIGIRAGAPPCSSREQCTQSDNWTFYIVGDAKIWYLKTNPADQAKALQVVAELPGVWSKLTGLMGRGPIQDTNDFNNGGDYRLDIAITPMGDDYGMTFNYPPGCEYDSVHIMLNSGNDATAMNAALAHEFMHAIQWHYDVSEFCLPVGYGWLMEATATWAIDYVYPDNNFEQKYAKRMLEKPELSLDATTVKNHEYGAYLFPFYLSRLQGAPATVRSIWEATEDGDSLEALDQGVGNLDDAWFQSVAYNWNRDPVDDYNNLDGLQTQATAKTGASPQNISLGGASDNEIEIDVELPYLSAWYAHYAISDSSVRTFAFYNGWTYELKEHTFPEYGDAYVAEDLSDDEKKGLRVQAIVKIDGNWQSPEDLTDAPYKTWCRDKNDEKIQELVLIFSNSDIERRDDNVSPKGLTPRIRISNIGCGNWEGSVNFNSNIDGVVETVTIDNLVWERVQDIAMPSDNNGSGLVGSFYNLTGGTLAWTIGGADSSCTYDGRQSGVNVATGPMDNVLQILRFIKGGEGYRKLIMMGFGDMLTQEFAYTMTCTNSDGSTSTYHQTKTLGEFYVTVAPGRPNDEVQSGGTTIEGDEQNTSDEEHISGSWSFSNQAE